MPAAPLSAARKRGGSTALGYGIPAREHAPPFIRELAERRIHIHAGGAKGKPGLRRIVGEHGGVPRAERVECVRAEHCERERMGREGPAREGTKCQ